MKPAHLRHRWSRLGLGVLFSAAAVIWLVTILDGPQVTQALAQANYGWVGLGLAAVLATLWARVRRWHTLLNTKRVSRADTLYALVLGQLLNLVLPARLGDLGRAYLITRAGYPGQLQALGTVALEKIWDIVVLISLVMALSFWQPLPVWVSVPARLTAAGGILMLGLVILFLWARQYWVVPWNRWRLGHRLPGEAWLTRVTGRLLDGLEGLRRPQVMPVAGGWSVLVWCFGALTNLALLEALHLPSSPVIAFLLLVVLQMGVAVPSVPGRIGIFEAGCLAVLLLFGVETNTAVAYGVMLHAVVLCPPVALGLWGLLRLDVTTRQAVWKLT